MDEQNQGSFAVTVGGESINMVPLQNFANYTLYGGNVSAWAGQDTTLRITQLAPPLNQGGAALSVLELDDIVFSPAAVPEPRPLALTCIAGLLFALYRRFAPNRQ